MELDGIHPVLKRQIDKCEFEENDYNQKLNKLISMVSKTYDESDRLRYIKERAVDVSSQELREMNNIIQQEKNALQDAYNDLVAKEQLINEQNNELTAQKNYAASLLTSIADMLMVIDTNNSITDVNDSLLQQLNLTKENIIGKNISFILQETLPITELINLAKIKASTQHAVNYTTTTIHNEQTVFQVLVSAAIILNDKGEVTGAVCIAKDISELKKLEKENADKMAWIAHAGRLASLGEMATGIAHELNQPLSIIRTDMQTLDLFGRDKLTDADVKEIIASAICQVDRASNIINHMRSFARKQQDKGTLMDITESINKAVGMFNEQFRLHEITIQRSFDPIIPQICAESQQIEQMVVNLLSNARYAVEAMREKTGRDFEMLIKLNLRYVKEKEMIIFEVIDNGIGMSKDVLEHCLDAFYTTKKVGEGTGLGLMIVYNIAKSINATIEVKSEEGQGATFSINIPVGAAANGE